MRSDLIFYYPGEYYHFYNCGIQMRDVFSQKSDFRLFTHLLKRQAGELVDIVAFCLMPDRFNILARVSWEKFWRRYMKTSKELETGYPFFDSLDAEHIFVTELTNQNLKGLRCIKDNYTHAYNQRYGRVGPLFERLIKVKYVAKDQSLVHLSRYIHLLPVLGGAVKKPEDWEFSSYKAYIETRRDPYLNTGLLKQYFHPSLDYRNFVEAYAPHERELVARLLFD